MRVALLAALLTLGWMLPAWAQSAPSAPTAPATPTAPDPSAPSAPPVKLLVDQIVAFFPLVETDIVEVDGSRVTLAAGRGEGVLPGVELVAVRQGREIYHPVSRKFLGRVETTLGRLVVTEVSDQFSIGRLTSGTGLAVGDRARAEGGKIRLTFLTLVSGPRSALGEAATNELVQELERRGRFQVAYGEQIGAWLGQQQISADEFMKGKGVREAARAFNLSQLLVVHFTTVQGKPLIDARFFSTAVDTPLVQSTFAAAATARARSGEFSAGGGAGGVKLERRSLMTRLLSGSFEPYRYSADAASIPIRALATFPFLVTSMDVAVAPADKASRIVVTDGQRVYLYRLDGEKLEAEWTYDKLMVGSILNVQFADLDGDGTLEVIVNRQDYKAGMLSYILTTRNGGAAVVVENIPLLLLAVDERGDGLKRQVWGHRPDPIAFFMRGSTTRYALKDDELTGAGRVFAHDTFRLTGATFSNISGKDIRVVAFIDEQNRLKITSGGQEMWRSLTPVGGGLATAHLQVPLTSPLIVDKYFKMEPTPLSVDLDGDGVEEIVVPVNEEEAGRMAVVFRGPTGFRMQVVTSGFEGMITGLGSVPGDPNPALVMAVVKRLGVLKRTGETQIILTLPE